MQKKSLPILVVITILSLIFLTVIGCSFLEEESTETGDGEMVEVTEESEFADPDETEESVVDEPDYGSSDSSGEGGTWLIMLYQDADDPTLEEDIFMDLNEAERIGSSESVSIVAQIDRYDGEFEGEQDFTSTKRFFLTQDDDLSVVNSEEIEDLGEVNMADAQTLVDFATWAIQTYPADHHVLILSDHGTGWPGGWTDPDPENDYDNIMVDGFDDMLYLQELDNAYAAIIENTGIEKFEMIGYDACLMASLEVLSATAPYARYAVLSQEVEPSMGWAYTAILEKLVNDPGMSGAKLAKTTVESYIVEDIIVVDEEARAKYSEVYYSGLVSEEQLREDLVQTVTLSAIDLEALPELITAVDNLALAMSDINQKMVAAARTHTRAFESVYGDDEPSPYIDLGHFAKMIKKESSSPKVSGAADEIKAAMGNVVIAEMHGDSKKSSTGISIYFPTSGLFEMSGSDYVTYTGVAGRFSEESLWDDFLVSHYTGEPLEGVSKPQAGTRMVGPGASEITIDPIELSADTIAVEDFATLTTTITGDSISYIYIFTGRYNEDLLEIVDIDFIDSEDVVEVDGTVYPDWGDTEVPMDFDWEAIEYYITDGVNTVPALLQPDTYGIEMEDTIYTVEGIFVLTKDKSRHYAVVSFDGDGNLIKVMGFSGEEDTGPQHEITPSKGDEFIVYVQSIPLDENEEADYIYEEGGSLTFDGSPWTWDSQTAAIGDYVVGFIAEDMDGNLFETYTGIIVE
ncbi:MAG: clostripain-related cysteine peptidase [Anaerolineaceae bacterium]